MKSRKTRTYWDIEANHGSGWELETSETTRVGLRTNLKAYRENCPGIQLRVKVRRERIEAVPVLRVAFRVGQGDVVAVLPDLPANDYRWVCYAHVGQHSECSRDWYYRTRRATSEEYAPLLAELRSIYEAHSNCVLRVVSRISHRSKQP